MPETAVDIWPMPVAELEETSAVIVTFPAAPAAHCAIPLWLMVAMFKLELDQLPVYGGWKETGAGDGGWLKVPVAVNCTCPMVKFCASALAGVTMTDWSMRFELEYIEPQPRV